MALSSATPSARGIGHVGLVWLMFAAGAAPALGAVIHATPWDAWSSAGLLVALVAARSLLLHYAGRVRRLMDR
jgi:hypothetical protein